MEQPKGFVAYGQEHLVCRLRKSLYGLKQASRQWYKKFHDFIQSVSFSKSDQDHCPFTKIVQDGSPVFLIIYVDDMLLSGRHAGEVTELVRKLRLKFSLAFSALRPTRSAGQQIHAQPRSIALEHSQACVQISSWHKRPRHSFRPELNFRRSWLHRLGLRRLCGQSKINN